MGSEAKGETPKLVVAIVVDQLRYDYLERFHHQFSTNGFKAFTERGTFMTFGRYDYAPTVTGPGHASVFAGSGPAMHGIIGNDWFDKRTGKTMYCVADPSVEGVGTATNKSRISPKNFIGDSFADELRLRYQSKVVAISIKDRGAVLPGGRQPTGAYWFEYDSGNFVTSSYYMKELPEWVRAFNDRKRVKDWADAEWDRLLPADQYDYEDDVAGEGTLRNEKKPVFPHVINYKTNSFDDISATAFGHQILMEMAIAAVEGEDLGRGPNPDLLCVSFSSLDSIGHTFGPYSHEIQDAVVRLDRQLETLFNELDDRIGLENVVMMLTADHAVAPTPEFAATQGLPASRFDSGAFMSNLGKELNKKFGERNYFQTSGLVYGQIFLNHTNIQQAGIPLEDITSFIREYALDTGIFHAGYTREQLLDGRAHGWVGQLILNGYNHERGGDITLVTKPFVVPGGGKTGTTHGSPWSYDTQVPILFYGSLFNKGRYPDPFYISDITPTLCAALGINSPAAAIGKPLPKVIRSK
ncbi:MAG: alkaline phosphatase family protein [Verrucomicrobiales bacterium]